MRFAQTALKAHIFHYEGGIGLTQLRIFPAQCLRQFRQLVNFVGKVLEVRNHLATIGPHVSVVNPFMTALSQCSAHSAVRISPRRVGMFLRPI